MRFLLRIRSLLANLLGKERIERQLDNELRAYVEMATDEKIAAGVSASEARRTTLAEFGGVEQVKQSVRDHRARTRLEAIWQDVYYGCRQLVRNPGFTAAVIVTLALSIGAIWLLLLLIRRNMIEPEHFAAVRERRRTLAAGRTATAEEREFLRFVPLQLFNRELRFGTLVGLLFALGTLLAIWTTVIWLPTIQSLMLEKEGIKGAAAAPIIGRNMMLWGIGGIFGYASFGFIADLIGRRPTVALYNVGTLVLGLTLFLAVDSMAPYPYLLVIYGFFVLGVFSGHAVYIPELFPTHVRATAVSFCNGTARVITSFGPLVAGLLAAPFGGNFNKPAAIMTCFALLSIYAMYLGRETRNDPLPL